MKTPEIWEIIIGIFLIIIGIISFFLHKHSKESVENYKIKQLEQYKKENPKFRGDYESSKLLLPWSQRCKLVMWPTIGLSLIIIGISISTGLIFGWFTR